MKGKVTAYMLNGKISAELLKQKSKIWDVVRLSSDKKNLERPQLTPEQIYDTDCWGEGEGIIGRRATRGKHSEIVSLESDQPEGQGSSSRHLKTSIQ